MSREELVSVMSAILMSGLIASKEGMEGYGPWSNAYAGPDGNTVKNIKRLAEELAGDTDVIAYGG